MISVHAKGDFKNTDAFLKHVSKADNLFVSLSRYAQEGVDALARATPMDSGVTASSWTYEILRDGKSYSIIWGNTHVIDGRPIAILLQYGHGTRNGGYVYGRDYINPSLRPLFDRIAADVWKEVTSA